MATQYEHLANQDGSHEDLPSSNGPAYLTRASPDTSSTDSPRAFRCLNYRPFTWSTNRDDGFRSPADRNLGTRKDQFTSTSAQESVDPDGKPDHTPVAAHDSSPEHLSTLSTIRKFFLRCIKDQWILEWVALWTSLVAMIGMFVLLHIYNGYPSSTKLYGLHINSWISGLNTVSKAAMIYPIAGAMGQCKWIWFLNSRALNELGKFDSASQDPKEALSFLWRYNAMSVASLGALVTILTLGMDFFVQNAVNLEVLQSYAGEASTTRVQNYNATITSSPAMMANQIAPLLDVQIIWALYAGAFGDPLQSSVSCPTGNCTWDRPYTSLALCNKCQNISHQIQIVNTPVNISGSNNDTIKCRLPNGLELYELREYEDSSQYSGGSAVEEFVASTSHSPTVPFGPPLNMINFTALSVNQAYECSVFLCVNQYDIAVTNGIVTETVVQTWDSSYLTLNSTSEFTYQGQSMSTLVLPHDEDDYSMDSNPVFSIGSNTYSVLQDFLSSSFSGDIIQYAPITSPILEALADYGTFKDPDAPDSVDLSNLPGIMANITQSISAALRQAEHMNTTIGSAYRSGTYIQVIWYWLIFPGVLLMITLVFLAITIGQTKAHDIMTWKSSPLPLLFHGLSSRCLTQGEDVLQLSEMDTQAKDMKVKLVKTDKEGWKLD
ncbi:hypothetical protein MMC27_002402 [Xylographa pallens]|nr:hypothetical protein [Xylographa pallens]